MIRGLSCVSRSSTSAYSELMEQVKKAATLSEIEGILSYDEQVFMPPGAAASRSRQKSVLAGIAHEQKTGEAMRSAVEEARKQLDAFEGEELANVRLALEDFDKQSRKSRELAEEESRVESEAFEAWKKAREASDFSLFESALKKIFEVKKTVATVTRPETREPYDGAMDAFERGMTAQRLDEIFAETKKGLKPILDKVLACEEQASKEDQEACAALSFDHPGWQDTEAQAGLARKVAGIIGYDFERGRLDVSAHPFTGGAGPSDTRITTRYSKNWAEGFSGTVHEVGHALYEQGRRGDGLSPASRAMSMGVHESQSLLWERMVMQSKPFWQFATPLFHEYFPHTKDATPEDFYKAVNRVSAGDIRVEADELTYPFHVFLRYDIERKLFDGDMKVEDIPSVWSESMRKDLNREVDGAGSRGALQDIHWSFGAIGYFPSYTLGAIMAAQIFQKIKSSMPTLDDDIAAGNFTPLKDWLRANIHEKGSVPESPDDLINQATGGTGGISPQPFLDYLEQKYTDLYNLSS